MTAEAFREGRPLRTGPRPRKADWSSPDHVAGRLTRNDYLLGEKFSVADAYLYNVLRWPSRVNVDISGYAAIGAYMARMKRRPSVRASLDAEGF